jgi:hypothetical protein
LILPKLKRHIKNSRHQDVTNCKNIAKQEHIGF